VGPRSQTHPAVAGAALAGLPERAAVKTAE
jgi:hypothetical protein